MKKPVEQQHDQVTLKIGNNNTECTEEEPSQPLWDVMTPLLYYFLFGFIHEMAHLTCATCLGVSDGLWSAEILNVFIRALFGRQCAIPAIRESFDNKENAISYIRHSGWITSLLLALSLHYLFSYHNESTNLSLFLPKSKHHCFVIVLSAYITALEAITTDLLQFTPIVETNKTVLFFCGNFGIILINPQWLSPRKKFAINTHDGAFGILRDMISITMMRGAQTGGIVTFTPSSSYTKDKKVIMTTKGVRSRVVNRKRTDLSDKLMKKMSSDLFFQKSSSPDGDSMVRFFMGHTRLATSSVANFDGTHPHRWTKPKRRRVYDLESGDVSSMMVENYVTHNGDFEMFDLNGTTYETEACHSFLTKALGCPVSCTVDSVSIAGFMDLIRTRGCFALSIRYALCLGMKTCTLEQQDQKPIEWSDCEKLSEGFEETLEMVLQGQDDKNGLIRVENSRTERRNLVSLIVKHLQDSDHFSMLSFMTQLHHHGNFSRSRYTKKDEETGEDDVVTHFVQTAVDAFFDNDLFHSVKLFMRKAHGSFGLVVASSLDAGRQLCIAARGQTMSVAFYPKKGIVCYGSETTAVKVAMAVDAPVDPEGKVTVMDGRDNEMENEAVRIDLDDLGGEICLLDFSQNNETDSPSASPVSYPNRHRKMYHVMQNKMRIVLYQQNPSTEQRRDDVLFHRMTLLTGNELVQAPKLQKSDEDIILSDIRSIPRVCQEIQHDWQNITSSISFNRLSALTLSRCLIRKLEAIAHSSSTSNNNTNNKHRPVDILLTGCEVSLWLAEQFASDLKKTLPNLHVLCMSSNKLLGLYGQEPCTPCVGFTHSTPHTINITEAIVIICSHSGGTFGPLQCASLLPSLTKNIFAVTGEWDTQINRQLRALYDEDEGDWLEHGRVFTTGVGLSTAEPCSLTVAAMHQLLTQMLEHICMVVLGNARYRRACGALVTERDLQILERCNRDNITALEKTVCVSVCGEELVTGQGKSTSEGLKSLGRVWSEHVLENARGHIITFFYVILSVSSGWSLITGIGILAGVGSDSVYYYFLRFLDSLVYFFLPQINITLIRLWQRRNLLHRMTGRTILIGDIPWVSQCAAAFLSKLFAASYSIASITVFHANPYDHLVHKFAHRVVRGTLMVCGRPDGRLMALTSAESSVLLSVNQASSIQSWGGRCESVTIGHNPYKNALCFRDLILPRSRPLFLCERVLDMDNSLSASLSASLNKAASKAKKPVFISSIQEKAKLKKPTVSLSYHGKDNINGKDKLRTANSYHGEQNVTPKKTGMSSHAIMGKYSTLNDECKKTSGIRKTLMRATNLKDDVLNMSCTLRKNTANLLTRSVHGLNKSIHGRSVHGRSKKEKPKDADKPEDAVVHKNTRKDIASAEVYDILMEKNMEQVNVTQLHTIFETYCSDDQNESLTPSEFNLAYRSIDATLSDAQIQSLFQEGDSDNTGRIDFPTFFRLTMTPQLKLQALKSSQIRDERTYLVQVTSQEGPYFDDDLYKRKIPGVSKISLAKSETLAMELYESRIASMQRFVAMVVMFHEMASKVERFFERISFGYWGWRMDRTHSIMRVATTASPVSGASVRKRMDVLRLISTLNNSVSVIANAWLRYKRRKVQRLMSSPLLNREIILKKIETYEVDEVPDRADTSGSDEVSSDRLDNSGGSHNSSIPESAQEHSNGF